MTELACVLRLTVLSIVLGGVVGLVLSAAALLVLAVW